VGILSTISNVAGCLYLADTRRHETHDSGKREDDARGFRPAKASRRETLARCRDDKFRDRARSSEDCGETNAGAKTSLKTYSVKLWFEFYLPLFPYVSLNPSRLASFCHCRGCGIRCPARISVAYGFETPSAEAIARTVDVTSFG